MEKKAHLSGILFAVIFGFTFMFSKTVMEYIKPMGLLAYRFLVAYLAFEILRIFGVVKIRFSRKYIIPVLLVTIMQPILYFIFEAYGLMHTSSGEAGMMIALIPIFVTILSAIILKEKPKMIQVIFILFSFLGVIIIQAFKSSDDIHSEFIGFVLLFFAVLTAALFNIASRYASKTVSPYELTYFMMMSGAIAFNSIYLVQLGIAGQLENYFTNMLHTEIILPILYLGIVASIGGFFLVNFTLKHIPAHVSSIYSNIATVIAVCAGAIFLHEKIELNQIIGGLMIIIGVYGVAATNYRRRKRIIRPDQFR